MSDVTAMSVEPVTGTGTYKWNITIYEERGTCWIKWSSDAPFRPQQGRVCLYPGAFPADPGQAEAWQWDDQPSPFNTNKLWGAGWCAAWIGQQGVSQGYKYAYVAKTPVTKDK